MKTFQMISGQDQKERYFWFLLRIVILIYHFKIFKPSYENNPSFLSANGLSNAQVQTALDFLNADFNSANSVWDIEFRLARFDPNWDAPMA